MDETTVNPEADKIAPEGSVEAEIAKVAPEAKKDSPTVPLSVFLDLKNELKEAKQAIKESSGSKKPEVTIEAVKDLAKKYPDVEKDFIEELLSISVTEAEKRIEQKYTPLLTKQDEREKAIAFNTAFDNVFNKALKDNPDLPTDKIDKEVIKALATTPAYQKTPIADIIVKLYGNQVAGRETTENNTRGGADREIETVDLNRPLTREQEDAVLADPVARKKYFDALDKTN